MQLKDESVAVEAGHRLSEGSTSLGLGFIPMRSILSIINLTQFIPQLFDHALEKLSANSKVDQLNGMGKVRTYGVHS